ncbi:LuxR family transcriptional regulator [Methylobacterium sp. J-068]|uniref:LuxR family transcriptional regulator n=1 Tax=Methylobacterium sp. J-068 TaxID=2836649 RepID=UPI001FBB84B7|nr:response regulator transcription factor [Methylobacterium sp. J-068]MCJ2035346.1 response regulator transcription factor [Methylobacterium sp. J-068]
MSLVAMESSLSATESDPSTVVIVDPRVLFRESLIFQIQKNGGAPNVLGFCTVAQWQAVARERAPASVIVIAATHRSIAQMECELDLLAAVSPGVPVVLLSELEDYHQVAEAMRRGLSGFIPMTSSVKVAQSAIALVLAGGCFIPSGIVCTRDAAPAAKGQASGSVRLTERETAVLGALQIGKPNKVIAYELNMCTNTVKVHVRNIMKKLQAKNRTELAYLVNTKGVVSWGPRIGGAWFHALPAVDHGAAMQPLAASPLA